MRLALLVADRVRLFLRSSAMVWPAVKQRYTMRSAMSGVHGLGRRNEAAGLLARVEIVDLRRCDFGSLYVSQCVTGRPSAVNEQFVWYTGWSRTTCVRGQMYVSLSMDRRELMLHSLPQKWTFPLPQQTKASVPGCCHSRQLSVHTVWRGLHATGTHRRHCCRTSAARAAYLGVCGVTALPRPWTPPHTRSIALC